MYMLVYCVDRDITKGGVYKTHEEAYEAMLSRIADLTGERPEPDDSGYALICNGCNGEGEVFHNWAYLDEPRYGTNYHYDWAILGV